MQDLKYATLATVSRCGMVWFSEDVLSTEMIFENYMLRLKNIPLEEGELFLIYFIPYNLISFCIRLIHVVASLIFV